MYVGMLKKKRSISKRNDMISYRSTSINGNFSIYQKSKSESKTVSLIKSEVQLVIPNVVSFYYSFCN